MKTTMALIALSLLLLISTPGRGEEPAFEVVDFASVERGIAKEPAYVASPRYALFLFGPKGEVKVWAVLDKSSAELEWYDVLYLDKNADGDLTAAEERFQGKYDPARARAGVSMWIRAGDLEVPGTGVVHRDLRFSTVPKAGRKGVWFSMMWRGKEKVSGGTGATGMDSTVWSEEIASAPILRPTAEGPLSFAIWAGPKIPVLRIGRATRISFMVGNRGSGPDTLCYLDDGFLTPGEDRIFATVIAKDAEGRRVEARTEIRDKPC